MGFSKAFLKAEQGSPIPEYLSGHERFSDGEVSKKGSYTVANGSWFWPDS